MQAPEALCHNGLVLLEVRADNVVRCCHAVEHLLFLLFYCVTVPFGCSRLRESWRSAGHPQGPRLERGEPDRLLGCPAACPPPGGSGPTRSTVLTTPCRSYSMSGIGSIHSSGCAFRLLLSTSALRSEGLSLCYVVNEGGIADS